jgi:hypothetical protein
VLEAELGRGLAQIGSPYHETGTWLSLAGFGLIALAMLTTFVLVLRSLLVR